MEKELTNIVIFGPTHCGKSTLVGYLRYQSMTEMERNKFLTNLKVDLGAHYDSGQKFAYFFDIREDERTRTHDNRGTTKYTKINEVAINKNDFRVIDTPGADHLKRERLKGIFFGDIGLFMIAIDDIPEYGDEFLKKESTATMKQIFTPLNTWLKFKDKKKLLIVLSKMDNTKEYPFSKNEFEEASKNIKWFIGEDSLQIIPTSIDVDGEKSYNIFEKTSEFSWYNGPTLLDTINELIPENKHYDAADKPLLMYVDREYEVKGIGKIWRGKILQGVLQVDSLINIAPVRYYKNSALVSIQGIVKNIQISETKNREKVARIGDIVTFDMHNLLYNNNAINKKDIEIVQTTCIFDSNHSLLEGDMLEFEFDFSELGDMNLPQKIMILWFGRLISCKITNEVTFENNTLITTALDSGLKVALPVNKSGNFLVDNFLLEINTPQDPMVQYKYIKAKLKNISSLGR